MKASEKLKPAMNVCTPYEQDFFVKSVKKGMKILEYGSGSSTLFLSKLVGKEGKVVSMEHQPEWYEKVLAQLPENVVLYLQEPTSQPENGDDGTYHQFKQYIEKPLEWVEKNGPFDIIFIDGRARVGCASFAENLAHKDTIVFIHDYNHPEKEYLRPEYFEAEDYLTRHDGELTMWRFTIKALNPKGELPELEKKKDSLKKSSEADSKGKGTEKSNTSKKSASATGKSGKTK